MFDGFIRANIALCKKLTPAHLDYISAYDRYNNEIIRLFLHPDVKNVLDVGAGRRWRIDPEIKIISGIRLIGVDTSMDELVVNTALDERIELDASISLGVPDGSIDVLTGRAVVEHVSDVRRFLDNCHKALRPGGVLALTFINGLSPPALVNRAIPDNLSRRLLFKLWPGSEGHQGFKTYYDSIRASRFRGMLHEYNFEINFEYQSYFSSGYLRFFAPLYLISLFFDAIRNIIGIRDFAAFNLFVATKLPYEDERRLYISSATHYVWGL